MRARNRALAKTCERRALIDSPICAFESADADKRAFSPWGILVLGLDGEARSNVESALEGKR